MADTLLGELTPTAFLRRYWQKQPLLIRGAFPDFRSPLSPGELAGLACEPEVESRLVIQTRKRPGWDVRHGPFAANDFRALPGKRWTLLVQDADKHVPALAELLDHFRFVPNWRIDDLMASYAADGGGVGAHVDAYDVFLLQAAGLRRWEISRAAHAPARIPGLALKQVRDFQPEESWLLQPGDMLYLPPGVAHRGTALGECLTFSIGFRMPADAELITDFAQRQLAQLDPERRYADPDLTSATADPGYIAHTARRALWQRVRKTLPISQTQFDEWFGCYITEPKSWLTTPPERRRLTPGELRGRLRRGRRLRRTAAAKCAWCEAGPRHLWLFVDGAAWRISATLRELARLLCRSRTYDKQALQPWFANHEAAELLVELHANGVLRFARTGRHIQPLV